MKTLMMAVLMLASMPALAESEYRYLGKISSNRYDPESISNPYGRYGSEYSSDSINNPYGRYGSRYSNDSVNNSYANNPPVLIEHDGTYSVYSKEDN